VTHAFTLLSPYKEGICFYRIECHIVFYLNIVFEIDTLPISPYRYVSLVHSSSVVDESIDKSVYTRGCVWSSWEIEVKYVTCYTQKEILQICRRPTQRIALRVRVKVSFAFTLAWSG